MTATTEHRPAEAHQHTHGPDCGHLAVIHEDHVDYIHNGHAHHCLKSPMTWPECYMSRTSALRRRTL